MAAVCVWLAGCHEGVLDPAGPVGAGEKLILLDSLAIMLAIVVPVVFCTLAFAWWFRASNTKAKYRPHWSYSGKLELMVWSIPAMVVMFLGSIAWVGSHVYDPPAPLASKTKPVVVQVVAMDWKWLFIYPEQGVASLNVAAVPAGAPVEFRITSATVMNAFFVPRLGSMIYAMAGMTTRLNLQADQPGVYPGLAAQISGDGFSKMQFQVQAMAPGAFQAWVAKAKASPIALNDDSYAGLATPATDTSQTLYSSVPQGFFTKILAASAPGAPGLPAPDPKLMVPTHPPAYRG